MGYIHWWYVHFMVCKSYLNKEIKQQEFKNKKLVSTTIIYRCGNWGPERLKDLHIVTWLSRNRTENDQGVGAASSVHFRWYLRVIAGYFPRRVHKVFSFFCVVSGAEQEWVVETSAEDSWALYVKQLAQSLAHNSLNICYVSFTHTPLSREITYRACWGVLVALE